MLLIFRMTPNSLGWKSGPDMCLPLPFPLPRWFQEIPVLCEHGYVFTCFF